MLAKHLLHANQNFQTENASNSSAIQRQDFFHIFISAASCDSESATATRSLPPTRLAPHASPFAAQSPTCPPKQSVYPTLLASGAILCNVRVAGASRSRPATHRPL